MKIILFLCITGYAQGWGPLGHQLVVTVMKSFLNENGVRYLDLHVNEKELFSAATWADTPESVLLYPGSDAYHFSHTPYRNCQAFDFERDCGFDGSGECVVSGIGKFSEIAFDANQAIAVRRPALKFLIHLIGDIHQPLHTGFAKDHGGVDITLTSPEGYSLHELWDDYLVEKFFSTSKSSSDTFVKNVEHFANKYPEKVAEMKKVFGNETIHMDAQAWAANMATETSTTVTCLMAYQDETGRFIQSGDSLSGAYISRGSVRVMQQLIKAGVRLAEFLNILSGKFYDDRHEKRQAFSEWLNSRSKRPTPNPLSVSALSRFDVLPNTDHLLSNEDWVDESVAEEIPQSAPSKNPNRPKKIEKPEIVGGVDVTKLCITLIDLKIVILDCDTLESLPTYRPTSFVVFFVHVESRGPEIEGMWDRDIPATVKSDWIKRVIERHLVSGKSPLIPGMHVGCRFSIHVETRDVEPIDGEQFGRFFEPGVLDTLILIPKGPAAITVNPAHARIGILRVDQVYKAWDCLSEVTRSGMSRRATRMEADEARMVMMQKTFLTLMSRDTKIKAIHSADGKLVVVGREDHMARNEWKKFSWYTIMTDTHLGQSPGTTSQLLVDSNLLMGTVTLEVLYRIFSLLHRNSHSIDQVRNRTREPAILEFLDELDDIHVFLTGTNRTRMSSIKSIRQCFVFPAPPVHPDSAYMAVIWSRQMPEDDRLERIFWHSSRTQTID